MNVPVRGWVWFVVVVLVWGSGPTAIGHALGPTGGFGPLWLNGTRLAVAAVVLLVVGALLGLRLVPRRGWWRAILAGCVGWSMGNGLQFVAQTEVASGVAAVLVGLAAVAALAMESLLDRRFPLIPHLAGAALGVASLGFLVGDTSGGASAWGATLLVLAAVGWALGAILEARYPADAPAMISAAWQMGAGGLGLCAAALALGEPWPDPTPTGWLAWAWLALGCAALGFLAWVQVLRLLPVVLAMTQPTLSNVISVALGAWILGEAVTPWAGVGVTIALVGAALCIWPRLKEAPVSPDLS